MNESILTICLVNVVTLLASILVASFLAYGKRTAENIAMNANFQNVLEQLKVQTAVTENIKAAINDDVWESQRHFEMRRDAVYDAWRALRELETSLIKLRAAFSHPIPDSEDLKNSALNMRYQATAQFDECNTKYDHAKDLADLVVGKELPKHLSAYFQMVGSIAKEIIKGNAGYFTSERMKELSEKSNEIVQVARKELNVKNTDCVVA